MRLIKQLKKYVRVTCVYCSNLLPECYTVIIGHFPGCAPTCCLSPCASPLQVYNNIQMHSSKCINRRFDKTLILCSAALLRRLSSEPVALTERKTDSVGIPVSSTGCIRAWTHVCKMLGIKKAISFAVILQTITPNA